MESLRVDKINYYLNIAEQVAMRSSCLKTWYGSILTLGDRIISTGYNGNVRGACNCSDLGICIRKELGVESGTRYELCKAVHSEQNCILNAKTDITGATLYLVGIDVDTKQLKPDSECCMLCKRFLRNSFVDQVIIRRTPTEYEIQKVNDWEL